MPTPTPGVPTPRPPTPMPPPPPRPPMPPPPRPLSWARASIDVNVRSKSEAVAARTACRGARDQVRSRHGDFSIERCTVCIARLPPKQPTDQRSTSRYHQASACQLASARCKLLFHKAIRRRIAAIQPPREPAAWRRSGSPSLPEILLRQYLTFFHRGLIERVHAEEPRGDDGLQHEMHEQLAQARLVELVDMDGAHRAAVLGQRLGGGAAFGSGEVANGLAGEFQLTRELGEIGGHARTAAGGGGGDDGDQLVARAGDVELQLAMLIDRSERGDGRRALAVLAQALGPELHVP